MTTIRRAALLLTLTACARSPAPPEAPVRDASAPVQTDSLDYSLAASGPGPARFALRFTYANPGPDTVYHVTCWGGLLPRLERREGGKWVTAFEVNPGWDCVQAIALPPASIRRDSLTVCRPTSPVQSSCAPWPVDGIDGTYRLMLDHLRLHYDPHTGGDTLPEPRRISNSFLITSLK